MKNAFPVLLIEEEAYLLKHHLREELNDKSYEELLALLPRPERSFGDIIAASVIELRAISVTNADCDNDKVYAIYGTIHLVDGDDNTFVLYDRQPDNPETISNGGLLAITLPTDRAISGTGTSELQIDLRDGSQNGAEIIKGIFEWDCTPKGRYNGRYTELFQVQDVSIAVDFDLYLHAVVCKVGVEVLTDFNGLTVYGEIVARSGKLSTILLDRKPNDSVNFNPGTDVQLSRSVVIRPVLSPSLNIHVTFFNASSNEKIFEETIPFSIWGSRGFKKYGGPSGLIEAQVQWTHPSSQPNIVPQYAPTSTEVINKFSMFPRAYGPKLLEIYSVSIFGNMDEEIDIWGSIKLVWYPGDAKFMFNKDKPSPQKLRPGGTLSLQSYTDAIVCNAFNLTVELRDASNRSISWGEIIWDERAFVEYIGLLGWHLCSVVASANGYYAAVHYSVFQTGVQAIVRIYLIDKNLNANYFQADGTVYAEYNDYDYSTSYQREYYRKKLFGRNSSEPLLSYPFNTAMLSESSIFVPEGSALVLDVDVTATSSPTPPTPGVGSSSMPPPPDSFREMLEFKTDNIDFHSSKHVHRRINQSRSSMELFIQVEWMQME